MKRVSILSLHTSPLAQPGVGDGGGMNVYVRELVSALAHAGLDCTTYTRAWRPDLPRVVNVEPNHRVVHVEAGDFDLPKNDLVSVVDVFAEGVRDHILETGGTDVLHGNYWLSGIAGHRVKHELNLPLVMTFHTFSRVKAQGGDPEPVSREDAESSIIGCTDAICVSCTEEERQFRSLYGIPPGTIEIVAPGVEQAFFAPGEKRGARHALRLPVDVPVMLFVGRIQPLKGLDVAVETLARLADRRARLVVVGGASGNEGESEVARIRSLIESLGVVDRVDFVAPQAHHMLSTYYRAADVVIVPSRSESFGLVALEAAACGVPVVASGVGGLITIVEDGVTGHLVADRSPDVFASHVDRILSHPVQAAAMGARAAENARRYTWSFAAARLRRAYADVTSRNRILCR
ncbi:MAG: glycosyltransferase family 1 protein [Actinobacteria bacterium]|nr:glycosyltransferase family 1 protein [Actinomycetota bacterium]